MMKLTLFSFLNIFVSFGVVYAQSNDNVDIHVGAYYFDGWTGNNKYQLNPKLRNQFPERQPVWGWVTSKQNIMDEQIRLAASYGLTYFNFCWFPNVKETSVDGDDKNNAMKLFLNSKSKSQMRFCITVVNHKGYEINKKDWEDLTNYWVKVFKDPSYLKVGNKPLLTVFDLEGLVATFGSAKQVNNALQELRKKCVAHGFSGVILAVCLSPQDSRIQLAEKCGYDVLTSYNRHTFGFANRYGKTYPISNMQKAEIDVWNQLAQKSRLMQIPTVTLNWDKRPQEFKVKNISSRYTGFSQNSVQTSVANAKKWVLNNKDRVLPGGFINIYAWNEYGEGAWLTPSKKLGYSLLNGLKDGLK